MVRVVILNYSRLRQSMAHPFPKFMNIFYDIIFHLMMKKDQKRKTIFAIGGGKGGVGKSIFSIALGTVLAGKGNRVALVDLDLGASNLHTYVGITKKTPTMADFILRRVSSLEDVLIDTSHQNLKLISGAEFIPGMANPAHWMKLKIMRHVRALPTDVVVIDLGAGVHFNTLDFFSMADRGIVVTSPEPGAVMNAYGFVKGALFRKLQNVFRHHATIGPMIDDEAKKTGDESNFSLDWLTDEIKNRTPEMLPIIQEVAKDCQPALVVNRLPEGQSHLLIKNLLNLCSDKLGLRLEHVGNIPDIPEITHRLLNIPGFLASSVGKPYADSVQRISHRTAVPIDSESGDTGIKIDYTDNEIEKIIQLMDKLDDSVFSKDKRDAWKLRMYFKPSSVVTFLINRGVQHEAFYRSD